ncbi:MAG: DegV family protein, partial [Saccharofermentanales bacterium]
MTETISGELLFQAILYGATRTKERRDDLNRINVFPVADNDTGSNLAHTMHQILRDANYHGSVRASLKDVARSALIGARGNSGAIFSQYFNGLFRMSPEKDVVTVAELSECFHEAYQEVYTALERPVEGTVITLMRAWFVSFRESMEQHRSAREMFETSLARIGQALAETRQTLQVMKRHGFVDAGALGYYYFMEGFVQILLGESAYVRQNDEEPPMPADTADMHIQGEDAEITYRYCTEVLLEASQLDITPFRHELSLLGDCLLVSSSDNLWRVHLHTDQPWQVIRLAADRGAILEQKAEDMVWQNHLAGSPENRIACVTDSIADLPPEFLFRHNVFWIPINILVDGISYMDKVTIDSEFLNGHLGTASSSQLNTEQIRSFLDPIFRHYSQVLILTVSSQMSGTYSRFKETLSGMGIADSRFALIDTRVNSGAQGLLVHSAVKWIDEGMPLAQIV